jgi:hypothetical protein
MSKKKKSPREKIDALLKRYLSSEIDYTTLIDSILALMVDYEFEHSKTKRSRIKLLKELLSDANELLKEKFPKDFPIFKRIEKTLNLP